MRNVKTFSICIPEELLAKLDEKAKNLHFNRSALITKIIEKNIEEEGTKCLKL